MENPATDIRAEPSSPQVPRRLAYPAAALALSLGAPAGLLLVRAMQRRTTWRRRVRAELLREWPSYLYVCLSTAGVFACLGRVLGRQADRLADLSETDHLTGLNNARVLQKRLADELARSARYEQPLSLLWIDLDRLKAINDRGGHAAGDRALRRVAKAMRSHMRGADIGARWGGDEFALLAPSTGMTPAVALAERLRTSLARFNGEALTISIGVAAFEPKPGATPPDPAHFMARADGALYEAKRAGRNRVVATRPVTAESETPAGQHAPTAST